MRILHCLHQYHPARGGAEWLMKNVSERLAARGHEVRAIATTAWSTEDYFLRGRGRNLMARGEERISGVAVRRVPFSRLGAPLLNVARGVANRLPVPGGNRLRALSWGPRSGAYFREVLRSAGEADILAAAPLPNYNVYYAWKAAKARGRPFVVIPCFHTEDRYSFHNPVFFRWMREADAVVTLTEWEKEYLAGVARIPGERLHALGVGIDFDLSAKPDAPSSGDIRRKYGIAEPEVVLFLGQHGLHKGILSLIEAMETVWDAGRSAALVIAGNPTAHTRDIEKKIGRLGPDRRRKIRLVKGFPEEEKRAFFQASSVFVSVSAFESFGIVFLEAWREKVPVIGCKLGGASKIIDEWRNGLLIDPGNPRSLAGALLLLLEDEAARKKMGEAGFAKAAARYAWDGIIPRYEALYAGLAGKSAGSRQG